MKKLIKFELGCKNCPFYVDGLCVFHSMLCGALRVKGIDINCNVAKRTNFNKCSFLFSEFIDILEESNVS